MHTKKVVSRVNPQRPIDRRHPLNEELVAWWRPIEGRVGSPMLDLVSDLPGTLVNNPTFTGRTPSSRPWVTFVNSSDQYINCGNPAAVQIIGALTIALAYRLNDIPTNGSGYQLVAKDADTGGRAYTLDVNRHPTIESAAGIRFYINGGGTSDLIVTEGRNPVVGDERWVCATYAPSTSAGLKLYINGRLASTSSGTSPSSIPSASTNLLIARRTYTGYTEPLHGAISDVRIYKTTLNESMVKELYNEFMLNYPDTTERQNTARYLLPVSAATQTPTFLPAFSAGFGW